VRVEPVGAVVAESEAAPAAAVFPEGVRFDGKRLVRTGLTLPVFNYVAPAEDSEVRMVDQTGIEPVTS
jgi:hypothetical protein